MLESKEPENTGINYAELIPADSYPAICVGIYDMGTQTPTNTAFKASRKVRIAFEIPEIQIKTEDGMINAVVGNEFTNSLAEKALLRQFLQSWRGQPFTPEELKGFNLAKLIGQKCLLQIVHNTSKADASKVYVNIGTCLKLPKQMQCGLSKEPQIIFDLDEYDEKKFLSLPKFVQDRIKKSPEYQIAVNGFNQDINSNPSKTDDDLPF